MTQYSGRRLCYPHLSTIHPHTAHHTPHYTYTLYTLVTLVSHPRHLTPYVAYVPVPSNLHNNQPAPLLSSPLPPRPLSRVASIDSPSSLRPHAAIRVCPRGRPQTLTPTHSLIRVLHVLHVLHALPVQATTSFRPVISCHFLWFLSLIQGTSPNITNERTNGLYHSSSPSHRAVRHSSPHHRTTAPPQSQPLPPTDR